MDDELTEIEDLENPKLRQLALRVAMITRLAAEKAIAHLAEPAEFPLPPDPTSLEGLFHSRFRRYRPEQRQLAIAKFLPRVKAPEAERTKVFGDLSKVNLRAATPVVAQVRALSLPAHVTFRSGELRHVVLGRPIVVPGLAAAVAAPANRQTGDRNTTGCSCGCTGCAASGRPAPGSKRLSAAPTRSTSAA